MEEACLVRTLGNSLGHAAYLSAVLLTSEEEVCTFFKVLFKLVEISCKEFRIGRKSPL